MTKILTALAACVLICIPELGRAETRLVEYEIDITRASVAKVLREFSVQTGLQIGYLPDSPTEGSLLIGPLKGKFTAEEALARLLHESGLAYKRVNARTIAVSSEAVIRPPAHRERDTDERGKPSDRPYMAVLIPAPNPVFEEEPADPDSLEGILVPASRLRRTGQGPSLVMIFDRKQLDALGVSSVYDVLKYVPQQPYTRSEGTSVTGSQFAEFRGLGIDTTLVLINGRRVAPSAVYAFLNASDLNLVPISAVERVEVLLQDASVVYGADAMGGVINIVLKKTVSKPVADLHYGTADGGADERRASLQLGSSEGRVRGSMILEYFERGLLLGASRELTSNQDYRRYGGSDWRSSSANPGNVRSMTPGNLPGLPAGFAAVPANGASEVLARDDFVATAGQSNSDSLGRFVSIVPEVRKMSAATFAQVEFTPKLAGFVELLYVDTETLYQSTPATLAGATVPAENPFNPFGVPVAVDYLFTGIGPRRKPVSSEVLRAASGIKANFDSWTWESSVTHSGENATQHLENDVDVAKVGAALSATEQNHALNVFTNGPGGTTELLASLLAEPVTYDYSVDATQLLSVLRGSVFKLPAGNARMAVAGEWRKESVFFDDTLYVSHDRETSSASLELTLPIANAAMQILAVRELSLTVAGRFDHYSDVGSSFNPQFSVAWRPSPDLLLQASYGTGFRAPSQFDMFSMKVRSSILLRDPHRNNELVTVESIVGGNPDLDPIESRAFTAGLAYTPTTLDGLQVSANYWWIDLQSRVGVVHPFLILEHEQAFADSTTRAQPTPAEAAAGLPGQLLVVDSSRTNLGPVDTSGVDVDATYVIETKYGNFYPHVSATWTRNFNVLEIPGMPRVERVGVADHRGTIPRWRIVTRIDWSFRGLGLSAAARHVPAYDDAIPGISPVRTGREIPAQTLVDLQGSIDLSAFFGNDLFRGVKVTAGAINLFDEEPKFSALGSLGFDLSKGDIRQRFSYIRVSKSF